MASCWGGSTGPPLCSRALFSTSPVPVRRLLGKRPSSGRNVPAYVRRKHLGASEQLWTPVCCWELGSCEAVRAGVRLAGFASLLLGLGSRWVSLGSAAGVCHPVTHTCRTAK